MQIIVDTKRLDIRLVKKKASSWKLIWSRLKEQTYLS